MTKPAEVCWIYLSPHLDDAVLSCGGIISGQTGRGTAVSIWTVCAGDPPEGELPPLAQALHARWQTGPQAAAARRAEDEAACARLGAEARHFEWCDCIYRRSARSGLPVVRENDDLFGPLHADEEPLAQEVAGRLAKSLPQGAQVVCPLTLGGHMDHRLVRKAAELLGRPLWYYADYPYAAAAEGGWKELLPADGRARRFALDGSALEVWGDAVAAYASQISTFWADEAEMRAALAAYAGRPGGCRLWHSGKSS